MMAEQDTPPDEGFTPRGTSEVDDLVLGRYRLITRGRPCLCFFLPLVEKVVAGLRKGSHPNHACSYVMSILVVGVWRTGEEFTEERFTELQSYANGVVGFAQWQLEGSAPQADR